MSDTTIISDGESTIIGELAKNRRETLRVSLKDFKGQTYADVRVFYPDDAGELRPTGKGVTFSPALLPKIIEFLQDCEAEARRRGLLG